MKTAGIAMAAWIASYSVLLIVADGGSPFGADGSTLIGNVNGALFTGFPLFFAVPFVYAPLHRWLARRVSARSIRLWLRPVVGAMSALPLVVWPLGLMSDSFQRVLHGELSALPALMRAVDPTRAWPFYLLYGTFGLLLGAWYAWRGVAPPVVEIQRRLG